ncbi:unnamed protein product, partial [Linum tenue]
LSLLIAQMQPLLPSLGLWTRRQQATMARTCKSKQATMATDGENSGVGGDGASRFRDGERADSDGD